MNTYQKIFERIPSVEELSDIKKLLNEDQLENWEDLYWCIKCICVYDVDACDAELLMGKITQTMELGLNLQSDHRKYIDLVKILVTLYSQSGRYEDVLSILNPILQSDYALPDWVYHDYVSAEIHTDDIISIIQQPDAFLAKLEKNQRNSPAIRRKQRAIFKDFVSTANRISGYYKLLFSEEKLTAAAKKYDVAETDGWKFFVESINNPSEEAKEIPKLKVVWQGEDSSSSIFPADDIQPEIKGAIDKKYEEALRELEIKERELEEKRLELDQKTLQLDRLCQEKVLLLENAKSSEEEKLKMQEQIENAERENDKLRNDIIEASQNQEKKFTLSVSDPVEQVIGHMHSFQYMIQITLSKWLNHYLPYCSRDWWNQCVIDTLSYEQRQRAYDERYTSITEFDLPALLRITSRNWNRIKKNVFLSQDDYNCLDRMFEVRNRWAHNKVEIPDNETIKKDLDTMSEFMAIIGCSKEKILEVNRYQGIIDELLKEV